MLRVTRYADDGNEGSLRQRILHHYSSAPAGFNQLKLLRQ
jgi:hypothetical protein